MIILMHTDLISLGLILVIFSFLNFVLSIFFEEFFILEKFNDLRFMNISWVDSESDGKLFLKSVFE